MVLPLPASAHTRVGLIYAKLLQLLPFLHNLVVMDAHPFAGNANAGGININDPVHIQVKVEKPMRDVWIPPPLQLF